MTSSAIQPHLWTRAKYEQLVEAGVFGPEEHIELIEGEIVDVMTPQSSEHSVAVRLADSRLRQAFGGGFDILTQMPLAIGADSEPEPDLAVVEGQPRDYIAGHPTTALLIVEVAETSLEYDSERKKRLYAQCGIQEYWIVNLRDRCLMVHREPRGETYGSEVTLGPGQSIDPLSCPGADVRVADLLP